MECTHDLAEKETACAADGLCPICQKEELDAMTPKLKEILDLMKITAPNIEAMKQEILDLNNQLLAHTQQLQMARTAVNREGDEILEAVWRSLDSYLQNYSARLQLRAETRKDKPWIRSLTT